MRLYTTGTTKEPGPPPKRRAGLYAQCNRLGEGVRIFHEGHPSWGYRSPICGNMLELCARTLRAVWNTMRPIARLARFLALGNVRPAGPGECASCHRFVDAGSGEWDANNCDLTCGRDDCAIQLAADRSW